MWCEYIKYTLKINLDIVENWEGSYLKHLFCWMKIEKCSKLSEHFKPNKTNFLNMQNGLACKHN